MDDLLNTIDGMWSDDYSEPLTDWDYESPQPEVEEWDTN
jgi:hypothetical protein